MAIIYVDELKDNGFNIYLDNGSPTLETIESVCTEEAAHATVITLIDERVGKFLSPEDYILHTIINDDVCTTHKITVEEYLEEN